MQMGRTNELRAVIQSKLLTLRDDFTSIEANAIAYGIVDPRVTFPHIIFDFPSMDPTDMGREDFTLDVHIWTKDQELAFDLKDAIVDMFSFSNDPQDSILPTFYLQSAGDVEDPDKEICHLVVRLQAQNYKR